MKRSIMLALTHDTHEICPRAWRGTPSLTGDYDLDQTIAHRNNPNLPARLGMYLKSRAYHPRTAYNSYHGYSGDD